MPWVFLLVFGFMYINFLLPKISAGGFAAVCLGAVVTLVFISFAIAAVTFSRDVLSGRYP